MTDQKRQPGFPRMSVGEANSPLPDWRLTPDDSPDDDADTQASPDVIAALGFDPFEDEREDDPPPPPRKAAR